ncbi:MAG: hypothetical protein P8Z37_17965 [Acidobacteriota bacterium]
MDRIERIARKSSTPDRVQSALERLFEASDSIDIQDYSDSFLSNLGALLVISPPMLDTLRLHPEYMEWLRNRICMLEEKTDPLRLSSKKDYYPQQWSSWNMEISSSADLFESLRAFKRREYLLISFLDVAGVFSFHETVRQLSVLADWTVQTALDLCRKALAEEESARSGVQIPDDGFCVIAMGKLGGNELNYSSDIDLIFCRRNPSNGKEMNFFSKLGERLVRTLSRVGQEGFLYRVDMRLRPHGSNGPLVPTIDSLINYYESWGEPWERQALIKARFIAGCEEIGQRFQHFVEVFTFSRQLQEAALEDVKRIKHRSEKEYAVDSGIHLKQGSGGIRDIEFYVQFSQLTIGWKFPEVRLSNTLDAIDALAHMKVFYEGEQSVLSLAYVFLRIAEHRLQLQSLTPQAIVPESSDEIDTLAKGLGFSDESAPAGVTFLKVLNHYRTNIRRILERIYLAPGYLRLHEREEELAQLLSDRTPKARVNELLSQFGFRDIDKAWQNIRLLALGPEGRLLPPGERRAFLEFAFQNTSIVWPGAIFCTKAGQSRRCSRN